MTGSRKTAWGAVATAVVLAVSACSSQDRATNPEEVRKLAGSTEGVQARQNAESHHRDVARAYSEQTPLAPGMLVLTDTCFRGKVKQWFDSNGDDSYKLTCSMRVTVYYGADPKRIVSVLDGILNAGDRPGSDIPFTHRVEESFVDRYRHHTSGLEETEMSTPTQTLSWDPVHGHQSNHLVKEPDACPANDPPVSRCVRSPASETVAAIRKRYGMVFKLDLTSPEYYKVSKSGKTYVNY
ncbi:hypothetical protein [Streptomyces sp. NPDC091209]|uniref:hypothetical protein n=1 Tax=Streptomyces sp. NPDC091209 TaxID=3365974 RepID=UPI00380AF618